MSLQSHMKSIFGSRLYLGLRYLFVTRLKISHAFEKLTRLSSETTSSSEYRTWKSPLFKGVRQSDVHYLEGTWTNRCNYDFFLLTFNKFEIVKPCVIIHRICRDFFFVLQLPLLEDDVFDADTFAEFLFVSRVVLVQLGALLLRQLVQGQTKDGASSLMFLKKNLSNFIYCFLTDAC